MLLYSRGQRYSFVLNEIIITKRQKRSAVFFVSLSLLFFLLLLLFLHREIKSRPSSVVCCLFWLPMSVPVSEWLLLLQILLVVYSIYYSIYTLLRYASYRLARDYEGLTLLHCGWAALLLPPLRFLFISLKTIEIPLRISGASETDIQRKREGERDKSRERSIRGCKIVQFMQIFALQITNSMSRLTSSPLPSPPLFAASALSYASAEVQLHRAAMHLTYKVQRAMHFCCVKQQTHPLETHTHTHIYRCWSIAKSTLIKIPEIFG